MQTALFTITQAFQELLKRLELNPARVALASQRYNAVKSTIEAALPGKTMHQIGSFQRKTKIRPLDLGDKLDVDAVLSFGNAYRFASPGENSVIPVRALEIIQSSLRSNECYRVMRPRPDAPTVVLQYADDFTMEIVPAYVDKMGTHSHGHNGPNCYIVGSADGGWRPADYDYDAAYIAAANQHSDRWLVPSIKMIKAFLRGPGFPLKSFHVEVLVALALPNAIDLWRRQGLRWGYQHALAHFLSEVPKFLLSGVALPNSYSVPVDSGLSLPERLVVGVRLGELGTVAWQICEMGDGPASIEAWHRFFGDPFPAP